MSPITRTAIVVIVASLTVSQASGGILITSGNAGGGGGSPAGFFNSATSTVVVPNEFGGGISGGGSTGGGISGGGFGSGQFGGSVRVTPLNETDIEIRASAGGLMQGFSNEPFGLSLFASGRAVFALATDMLVVYRTADFETTFSEGTARGYVSAVTGQFDGAVMRAGTYEISAGFSFARYFDFVIPGGSYSGALTHSTEARVVLAPVPAPHGCGLVLVAAFLAGRGRRPA